MPRTRGPHSMPWTLTRGDREIDGRVCFTMSPEERQTRTCPGCPAQADDIAFFRGLEELPLTDAEVAEIAPAALEWASETYNIQEWVPFGPGCRVPKYIMDRAKKATKKGGK